MIVGQNLVEILFGDEQHDRDIRRAAAVTITLVRESEITVIAFALPPSSVLDLAGCAEDYRTALGHLVGHVAAAKSRRGFCNGYGAEVLGTLKGRLFRGFQPAE